MKALHHFIAITFSLVFAPAFARADDLPAASSKPQPGHDVQPRPQQLHEGRDATGEPSLKDNGLRDDAAPTATSRVSVTTSESRAPHLLTNPDCLAAYYDFNDFDSATGCVRDKSGNGFHLTSVDGIATAADGIAGTGAKLNGGYLQAKGNPLAGADHFTISVWFKTAEPMNNYKLVAAAVWSGGNNASGWNVGTHYSEFWADNQEGGLRGDAGWERNTEFRKGEWNHLVISYDGSYVREYINGRLSTEIHGTGRRVGNGVPMTVGAWMGGFRFDGVLDELRIYRRALKEREIQSLHTAPSGRDELK